MPKLHVRTRHSDYVVDTDAQTIERMQREPEANDLSDWGWANGKRNRYVSLHLAEGEPLHAVREDGVWINSTPVESIKPVYEDAG